MVWEHMASWAGSLFSSGEALFGRFGATVALLALGIAIYGAIVGTFCAHLSKRLLYQSNPTGKKITGFVSQFGSLAALFFKYTILFPAITFTWFVLLASFLFLLSRTATLETVFVLSISVVAAVRILAYYNEKIAADVAMVMPLTLLGVLFIDPTLFNQQMVQGRLLTLSGALPEFAALVAFAVALEWILRIIYTIVKLVRARLGRKADVVGEQGEIWKK